jgi:acyl CoA:acetate/3-ketoacid CoA transferase alpha subunit
MVAPAAWAVLVALAALQPAALRVSAATVARAVRAAARGLPGMVARVLQGRRLPLTAPLAALAAIPEVPGLAARAE